MKTAVISPKVIILTSCASRKRASGKPLIWRKPGPEVALRDVADAWARTIASASALCKAEDMYLGRSFSEAKQACRTAEATMYIVSAGLGLVAGQELIPAYDLTMASGPTSLTPILKRLGNDPSDWWHILHTARGRRDPIYSLLTQYPQAVVLLAMPADYIALISAELATLSPAHIKQLRILTSTFGQSFVPEQLRNNVLAYDERLEGSAYAGTRTDFPQRALRHFVDVLQGHRLSLDDAHDKVSKAMAELVQPRIPSRAKKTDDEIIALLKRNWLIHDGRAGKLLRFLRDDALVACEQARFQGLWKLVKQSLEQEYV